MTASPEQQHAVAAVVELASVRIAAEARRREAEKLTEKRRAAAKAKLGEDTAKKITWGKGGVIQTTLRNVVVMLTEHPSMREDPAAADVMAGPQQLIAWDEMRQVPVWCAEPGIIPVELAGRNRTWEGSQVTDEDITRVRMWLEEDPWCARIGKDMMLQAVAVAAQGRAVNPLQDQVRGIPWDGVHRIDRWLQTYLGARANEQPQCARSNAGSVERYLSMAGRWWLIAAAARATAPGCKVDTVLVLEGEQGAAKSSALEVLGGEWYSAAALHLDNPGNLYPLLNRSWIIEIGEFGDVMRHSDERVKAFLVERHNEWTPKYSNVAVRHPRHCIFAATINPRGDGEYLRDPTGNRRFWPVAVGKIDLEALMRDREQLIAEAVFYADGWQQCKEDFESGEMSRGDDPDAYCKGGHARCAIHRWWPGADEEADFKLAQAARAQSDAWLDAVLPWLRAQPPEDLVDGIHTRTILEQALHLAGKDALDNKFHRRLALIMRELGFQTRVFRIKAGKPGAGKQAAGYYAPNQTVLDRIRLGDME
jgi:predicted P-loop ATPase